MAKSLRTVLPILLVFAARTGPTREELQAAQEQYPEFRVFGRSSDYARNVEPHAAVIGDPIPAAYRGSRSPAEYLEAPEPVVAPSVAEVLAGIAQAGKPVQKKQRKVKASGDLPPVDASKPAPVQEPAEPATSEDEPQLSDNAVSDMSQLIASIGGVAEVDELATTTFAPLEPLAPLEEVKPEGDNPEKWES